MAHLMAGILNESKYFERLLPCKILCAVLLIPFVVILFRQITFKQPETISWLFVFQAGTVLTVVVLLNGFSFEIFNTLSSLIFMFQACSALCAITDIIYMQAEIHYRQTIQMESEFMEHLWHIEQKQFEKSGRRLI